jgi:hypothetical protein
MNEEQGESEKCGAIEVRVIVEPGICGFSCSVLAVRQGRRTVHFEIRSECQQIQTLASTLGKIDMRDLFSPPARNPIFAAAERARCHPSCAIPCALMKAGEVALGLALPKNAAIRFEE